MLRLLRHKKSLLSIALFLLVAGVGASLRMRRELEPEVRSGRAVITAALPGAPASELQLMVSDPIEDLLRQTPGISDYRSQTSDGLCIFIVKTSRSESDAAIRERLRNRLANLRHELVAKNIVGLVGPRLNEDVSATYDILATIPVPEGDFSPFRRPLRSITQAVAALPSVSAVETVGLPDEKIVVEYRDAELADFGFTPRLLSVLVKTQSFLAPGGYVETDDRLASMHIDARLRTIGDLREVSVLDPMAGRPTTLDRLLSIQTESKVGPSILADGETAVCLAIARRPDADPQTFSDAIRATLTESCEKAKLGQPIIIVDNAIFIEQDYGRFLNSMGVSIALLFLILVAVLGWRVGSLVAFMVPLTIFSTMAVLLLLGFSMNRIVIAALVISAGIVLDNHIVVAQYLSRKLHEGVDRNVAMQETFRLMAPPMLVATLTSIIGFFPVLFADHLAAEYVADIVPVIGIALGFSYLFAFTATPIFTPATPAATSPIQSLEKWGRSIISRVVAQPRTALGITVVISVAGLVLLAARPSDFFPANNRTLVAIETILPVGASQESTRKAMARTSQTVEKVLQETQLVEAVTSVSFRGSSVPRFSPNMPQSIPSPNKGTMLLSFPHRRAMDAFRQKTGEILSADPLEMTRIYPVIAGPQIGWPVEIRITGPEALLEKVAPQLADTLAAMPELANPHCSSTSTVTRWKLTPKREQAAEKGVTPADIALAMSVSLNGLHSFDLGSGDQAVPVFVQPKQTKKDPAENMEDAYVYPEKGMPCLMDEVAEVESVKGPAAIERYRGVPAITFVADCAPGFTPYEAEQLAIARIKQILGSTPELVVTSVGLSKTAQEAKAALMKGVPWALIAVFLVILIQTHSFRLSLLAVGAIPFGMAGAGFGLLFFGMPIGFMSLIGLTAMAGLVVNFSVVMLASVKAHQGVSAVDDSGIIDGTVERIEPILLSVLSASCGMGVLYVFGGELWRSMAITMVSGLLLASVLVIVAVPASSKIFLCRNNRTP